MLMLPPFLTKLASAYVPFPVTSEVTSARYAWLFA